jgi:hypothetical protein
MTILAINKKKYDQYVNIILCLLIINNKSVLLQRDEVTGGLRKLHNEELHSLYSSLSIIERLSQGG